MKKLLKYQLLWRNKAKFRIGIPLVTTTLVMISMVILILTNTYQLERRLERYAETYSSDVSKQLADRISFRLKEKAHDVQHLAESFINVPDELLTENLLEKKEDSLDVSHLFILNEDGTTFPEQKEIEGLQDYLENEPEVYTNTHISFLGRNQVIYSTPIVKNSTSRLLISICTGQTLQDMLDDFNYEEKGRCCIANKHGDVIIAPSNMLPFQQLKQVFSEPDLLQSQNDSITSMVNDIRQEKSGWTIFRNVNRNELIVGYDFLGVCDWMVFTVLPHDLLSDTVKGYTLRFILVALILTLLIVSIIVSMYKNYHQNIKSIRKAALTDPLTQGDNETAFRMQGEFLVKEFPEQMRAVIYMNNKDFRRYNSRFGIEGANEILCFIYELLKDHLHERELVSRCNGTSFCLLLECENETSIVERVKEISHDIKQKLHDIYAINHHRIAEGAFLITEDNYDFIHMLDWAKIASTYHTSQDSCKIYDSSIAKALQRETELNDSFEQAIENHEFKLYIQPKISPKENRLIGGEVLVRWEHPKYGLVPPNDFIPLFERNGNICALDFYMFEETCKLLKEWLSNGQAIPLSVNLSRAHLGSHNFDFLNYFHTLKNEYQIPDGLIELELTESIILERQEIKFVLEVMNRIQSMGFKCSLDDFGYGYSCLTLLKDLNINTVKLDRQFFLNENEKSWIVIEELIRMAHQLQISVVAEGIDNSDQVKKLKTYNCDLIQGYVYAKPMSISDFIHWTETEFH